jgi:hypothetical protein
MLGLDAAGKTSTGLLLHSNASPDESGSYLIQAEAQPVRHDHPYWCAHVSAQLLR